MNVNLINITAVSKIQPANFDLGVDSIAEFGDTLDSHNCLKCSLGVLLLNVPITSLSLLNTRTGADCFVIIFLNATDTRFLKTSLAISHCVQMLIILAVIQVCFIVTHPKIRLSSVGMNRGRQYVLSKPTAQLEHHVRLFWIIFFSPV